MAIFKDITLGQYIPVDSFLHRLDPRTKIVCSLIFMFSILLFKNWVTQLALLLILLIAIGFSKINAKYFLRNLRPFIWLFLLTFILNLFYAQGKILWHVPYWGWSIYQSGLENGFLYTFRLIFMILIAAILTLTTSPVELMDALNHILGPLKKLGLPVYDVIMMMTLAIRFIPTLMMEAERIQKAQMSRGVSFEGNFIQRIKSLIPLIIPLFISSFRRADELALAMDARCYHGGEGRTSFSRLAMAPRDWIMIVFTILFICGNVVIHFNAHYSWLA